MRRAIAFLLGGLVLLGGTAPSAWAAPNDPGWYQQWNLAKIRAVKAWATSKGSGVVVAIIDTGVDLAHPDLKGRLVTGVNLVNGGSPPQDDNGHGTFMAGIVAAATGNNEGVASVAPRAKIMPVKVLKSDGTGSPETVADGIRWAVSNGADVINLSLAETDDGGIRLGSDFFSNSDLEKAIEYAANQGRFVSIAAGNDFTNGGTTQTAYADGLAATLVVGASTSADKRAAYSNYGGGLDVLAPGGGSSTNATPAGCQPNDPVVSTWWDPESHESGYGAGCGTSMAVAHVSGLAALLKARGYSASGAAGRILSTAKSIGNGYRRIDALAAVGSSARSPGTAPKPSAKKSVPKKKVTAAASPTNAPVNGSKVAPVPSQSITGLLLAADDLPVPPLAPRRTLVMIATALALLVGVANPLVRVMQRPR